MATLKQNALAKKIIENPRLTMGQAMREVGYSDATASHPTDVTNSIGWKQLMDKYLPDDELLKVHEEGLRANKVISAKIIGNANEQTDDFIEVPDHPTRAKYLDLAYKVKNKFQAGVQILNQGEMDVKFE